MTRRFLPSRRRAAFAAVLAGSICLGCAGAFAQTLFGAPDRDFNGQVNFSAADGVINAGDEVAVAGRNFKPGQSVSVSYGLTPLVSDLQADADGAISGAFTLPADAQVGIHPVVITATAPYAANVAELKVSPDVPLHGDENFDITRETIRVGMYQSAYSAASNALFVTSAVGRPPVSDSELVRLDADTLAVAARVTPAPAPQRPGRDGGAPTDGGVFAVYGVGVDDAHGNVWVTNSRQNTVAVYRQDDLSLVKQFEPGAVNHARDVVVDEAVNKAYSSATFQPEVVVFDTATLEPVTTIRIGTQVRGETFSAASLSLDRDAHRLYVVSNSTNEVAVIDTNNDEVISVLAVPGAVGAIGVSHDPQTGNIFVAAQGSDNLVVLNASGEVVSDTPVGAGALNVVFEPTSRRAFVSNRGASTVTVTDENGAIVANLGPAPRSNHVAQDGRGNVYVVNKSAGEDAEGNDTVWRIAPR